MPQICNITVTGALLLRGERPFKRQNSPDLLRKKQLIQKHPKTTLDVTQDIQLFSNLTRRNPIYRNNHLHRYVNCLLLDFYPSANINYTSTGLQLCFLSGKYKPDVKNHFVLAGSVIQSSAGI